MIIGPQDSAGNLTAPSSSDRKRIALVDQGAEERRSLLLLLLLLVSGLLDVEGVWDDVAMVEGKNLGGKGGRRKGRGDGVMSGRGGKLRGRDGELFESKHREVATGIFPKSIGD
jgi:hypothetical protein